MDYIAYYRLSRDSTKSRGGANYGLAAQRQDVTRFLEQNPGALVAHYEEIETGKKNDRPQLTLALAHAKKIKATLLIAKLDRLSRNLTFVSSLLDAGVHIIAIDYQNADENVLKLMAWVAEVERKLISKRIKAGLEQAKLNGVKLGNPKIQAINHPRSQQADAYALKLKNTLDAFKSANLPQRKMVAALNELGMKTARGNDWSLMQLQRTLRRIGELTMTEAVLG